MQEIQQHLVDVKNGIELLGSCVNRNSLNQGFSINTTKQALSVSTPYGSLEEFNVNYVESGNDRIFILTDLDNNIAAFAGFRIWNNGKVWQARNAETFVPYKGKALVGKIYRLVKNQMHKSIQSDATQTHSARKLWSITLPKLGLVPMIFDTKTEKIFAPNEHPEIDIYQQHNDNRDYHYTWIIERSDHYPDQNLLKEDNSLLFPVQGLWCRYTNGIEEI